MSLLVFFYFTTLHIIKYYRANFAVGGPGSLLYIQITVTGKCKQKERKVTVCESFWLAKIVHDIRKRQQNPQIIW